MFTPLRARLVAGAVAAAAAVSVAAAVPASAAYPKPAPAKQAVLVVNLYGWKLPANLPTPVHFVSKPIFLPHGPCIRHRAELRSLMAGSPKTVWALTKKKVDRDAWITMRGFDTPYIPC